MHVRIMRRMKNACTRRSCTAGVQKTDMIIKKDARIGSMYKDVMFYYDYLLWSEGRCSRVRNRKRFVFWGGFFECAVLFCLRTWKTIKCVSILCNIMENFICNQLLIFDNIQWIDYIMKKYVIDINTCPMLIHFSYLDLKIRK